MADTPQGSPAPPSSPSALGARVSQQETFQLIEADGTAEQVEWDTEDYDEIGGVDLSNNRITIQTDGLHMLVTQIKMEDGDDQDDILPAINTDGTAVVSSEMTVSAESNENAVVGFPLVDIRQLSSGTHVTAEMNLSAANDKNVLNGIANSYLAVSRIG